MKTLKDMNPLEDLNYLTPLTLNKSILLTKTLSTALKIKNKLPPLTKVIKPLSINLKPNKFMTPKPLLDIKLTNLLPVVEITNLITNLTNLPDLLTKLTILLLNKDLSKLNN